MKRSVGWVLLLALLSSGCSLIVENMLESKGGGQDGGPDSGPTGPACTATPDCLQLSDFAFDCTAECVGATPGHPGVCVTGGSTPNGTVCGSSGGARICVDRTCVMRACGDGFVDRRATPPEYCDDGDTNDGNLCNNACTRSCVPPARPDCNDNNVCNGPEACDTTTGLCRAMPLDGSTDGMDCMVGTSAGTCRQGACVVD